MQEDIDLPLSFTWSTGTVVSFSAGNEDDFVLPISARLRRRDTGLRATADSSMLVQSLLDLSEQPSLFRLNNLITSFHSRRQSHRGCR